MAPPMGKIMTVMARTASSNTKSGGKGSTGKARSGETKVMDAVEPSPVMGVLTKYGRDIACFILVILAVMFCASEWFRVQGVFGRMLHALASGLFGLMSVILPVFLALVAFSLIYETKRKSGNVRLLHTRCGARVRRPRFRHGVAAECGRSARLCAWLPAGMGAFQGVRHRYFRGRHFVLVVADYQYRGSRDSRQSTCIEGPFWIRCK